MRTEYGAVWDSLATLKVWEKGAREGNSIVWHHCVGLSLNVWDSLIPLRF